jgi:rhodanese-related sulfurtransferase
VSFLPDRAVHHARGHASQRVHICCERAELAQSLTLLPPTTLAEPVRARRAAASRALVAAPAPRRAAGAAPRRAAAPPARAYDSDDEDAGPAYYPEYPCAAYIEEVLAAFPDKAIATVEEARVLIAKEGGYTLLDVRSALELEEVGKPRGIPYVNAPLAVCKWKFVPQAPKTVEKTPVTPEAFIAVVQKKIPNKETPLVVMCSNGTQYSIDALEALDEAGYVTLVGMRGGFNAFNQVFSAKLDRRRNGEYAETYTHDGDSCGIHSSGAGFDRSDAIEKYVPEPKF